MWLSKCINLNLFQRAQQLHQAWHSPLQTGNRFCFQNGFWRNQLHYTCRKERFKNKSDQMCIVERLPLLAIHHECSGGFFPSAVSLATASSNLWMAVGLPNDLKMCHNTFCWNKIKIRVNGNIAHVEIVKYLWCTGINALDSKHDGFDCSLSFRCALSIFYGNRKRLQSMDITINDTTDVRTNMTATLCLNGQTCSIATCWRQSQQTLTDLLPRHFNHRL